MVVELQHQIFSVVDTALSEMQWTLGFIDINWLEVSRFGYAFVLVVIGVEMNIIEHYDEYYTAVNRCNIMHLARWF